MARVGRSPAYSPAAPSVSNIDASVDIVPVLLKCPPVIVILVFICEGTAADVLRVAGMGMGMGRTHSIRPLFSTTVDPHSRQGRHPTLTPRNDVAPGNDDDDDDDDDEAAAAAAACC